MPILKNTGFKRFEGLEIWKQLRAVHSALLKYQKPGDFETNHDDEAGYMSINHVLQVQISFDRGVLMYTTTLSK